MIAKYGLFFALAALAFAMPAVAQTYALTPQQKVMLDQLPPSQRQQAMNALQEFQSKQDNGVGGATTINEPTTNQLSDFGGISTDRELNPAVLQAGSELVITFKTETGLTGQEQRALASDRALQDLIGAQYFVLDDNGQLELPGVISLSAKGFTGSSLQQRLRAEPALQYLDADVSVLRYESTVETASRRFGQDLFGTRSIGFDPVSNGPIPSDYVLGPGDSIRLQLFGNINQVIENEIGRDGMLMLPELGPVNVVGLTFAEFRDDLRGRVKESLIGTQVSISVGQLKTIRVFVLGDAVRPGSYVVNGLSTISNALYASGGISDVGSLRNVQLKRSGMRVATLDLYDFLLDGDTSNDLRLQSGDVIFVPPAGPSIEVSGAVMRPAIYELNSDARVSEVIALAGGYQADAYRSKIRLQRVRDDGVREILSVNLSATKKNDVLLESGDSVFVPAALDEFEDTVFLAGHVKRPGMYQLEPGMRLLDLIQREESLKPLADLNYVLIRREDPRTGRITVQSADLSSPIAKRDVEDNPLLHSKDKIHVFGFEYGRQRVIKEIIEQLRLQTRSGEPLQTVTITGRVNSPGGYPLESGMRISDLIRAGGQLAEDAYVLRAELARTNVVDSQRRSTEIIDVDLASALKGDPSQDLLLGSYDTLRISAVEDWDSYSTVSVTGELRFPGEYRVRKGETLGSLIDRAGGMTDDAFPEGAIFLREDLRLREQEQIDELRQRLEAELAGQSVTEGSSTLSAADGDAILQQLRNFEATGRLVIQLANTNNIARNIELRDRDRLLLPKRSQEVTVIGETQQTVSHLYNPELKRDDYIRMSGGLTRQADKKLIFVVRASGEVVASKGTRWFGRRKGVEIRPGDTIVVPFEVDRVKPLTLWTSVTQIFYQAAIAVAAVNSFDN